jgi:glycosyl hydrolase group 75 (putative chitosanase)/carbohydrate binding protein with CBM35 domain
MRRSMAVAGAFVVFGSLVGSAAGAPAATTSYQAENGVVSQGVVESNHAGFTGSGFVNTDNIVGASVQWSVSVAAAGSTQLGFRFANGTTVARPMTVTVDGAAVGTPTFGSTSVWTTWNTSTLTATLSAGAHTVKATATTANGGPNLDSLTVVDSAGGGGAPTAQELLAKVTGCDQVSSGLYRTDSEAGRTIPVCDKNGAVFWKGDMDIDCDGQRTTQCNEDTDCCFLPETAFTQSDGRPLNAAVLPYVVVPSPSGTWDYRNFGIRGGGVVAIIYNDKVEYAVVGDTGPTDIIGEASYAAAQDLGINPDPSNGGTDSGVTYIVFKNSVVAPIEDHGRAITTGQQLARQFVTDN